MFSMCPHLTCHACPLALLTSQESLLELVVDNSNH
uniref:Uncharacterized protein n=1 Tax=Arundo donax TaxID=35708 RepID=A0A0A9FHU0_ARUDO